jgi:prephenate dehydratase
MIKKLKLKTHVHADTAGAASDVAARNDKTQAAIASELAGQIYGLDILINDIQDADHNTTRFIVLSRDHKIPSYDPAAKLITSFVFRVRNIPAALFKAMGGFATNGINMTKLESYVDEHFQAAQFFCDVEGHPESPGLRLALEELAFFGREVRLLGTYPAHQFRQKAAA